MRAKDRGISTVYYEAVAPTYDEAKDKAIAGIRLSEREIRIKEAGRSDEGVIVRAVSMRTRVQEVIRDVKLFTDNMDLDAKVEGREEAGLIFIDIEGDSLGNLIGRNGATLESLEYLLNIIHNRRFTHQKQIILDIGGYRKTTISFIYAQLQRAVSYVANKKHPYVLKPMPPKERKLAHLLMNKFPGFESRSIGEGEERRLEIFESDVDLGDDGPAPPMYTESGEQEDELMVGNRANRRDMPTAPLSIGEWDDSDEGSLL